ncbi:UspA domain-containing protein [Stanieria cyanosphaera PCC 7437]|uniref:UspA domain-containing protein n=1 Tax=Stanieria cyanosphaera (strain ATCC 29371 / PCC 7437) TaxID=111780 RepID=K9XZ70_STAC7|nr:universal stress protein [Stanieria cyanosphaera]AFZ36962.1 UspA domain-containing protein [Stanieria cyanosphaera PCC 7437]
MFRKILVAIDCSCQGKKLFEQALCVAKVRQAHLMLLQVISAQQNNYQWLLSVARCQSEEDFNFELFLKKQQIYRQEGLDFLRSLTRKATIAGIKTEFSQVMGSPCQIICTLAQIWQADLIMIGSDSYSSLHKIGLSGVSNYVTYYLPCSVLVLV